MMHPVERKFLQFARGCTSELSLGLHQQKKPKVVSLTDKKKINVMDVEVTVQRNNE